MTLTYNRETKEFIVENNFFIVRNGKKIGFESDCQAECDRADNCKLFNGRDCPDRIQCMVEKGNINALPKGAVKEYLQKERQKFDAFAWSLRKQISTYGPKIRERLR